MAHQGDGLEPLIVLVFRDLFVSGQGLLQAVVLNFELRGDGVPSVFSQ